MKFTSYDLKEKTTFALEQNGYLYATEVQNKVIPIALKGENVIVQSETGSGKTHAFLVPIIDRVVLDKKVQAIIIDPTRELARQTYDFATKLAKCLPNLTIKLFAGGEETSRDVESFKNSSEIIVATPGRLKYLVDFLDEKNSDVKTIVLDEADMLMENGFLSDIDAIIKKFKHPQIEVFSATINKAVEIFLKKYIPKSDVIRINKKNSTSTTVKHFLINTKHKDQFETVQKFLNIKNPYLAMVFTNSQEITRKLYNFLSINGFKCGILSGELEARERKSMLRRINNDEFRVIVCTDIASRGLDIEDVSDVLSVDLPNNLEYYFHRAGRCGRNFKEGNSYVFYDLDHIEKAKKLIDSGIKFEYLKFSEDGLVSDKPIDREGPKRKHKDQELEKEIQIAKHNAYSKRVKPG
ncbi:MAG: DEAD/DEAH box helicase, partial [Bacilli bacterium]